MKKPEPLTRQGNVNSNELSASNHVVLYDNIQRRWLRFSTPKRIIQAHTINEVIPSLHEVEKQVEQHGCHAAGFISYEASPAFDPALQVRQDETVFPLLWFGLYDGVEEIEIKVGDGNSTPSFDWSPTVTPKAYAAALSRIRSYIEAGDTYQVNFTFRRLTPFNESAWQTFLHFLAAQNPGYGGFLLTDSWALCSGSPELFFTLDGDRIHSRPMKGTAPRGLTYAADLEAAERLTLSPKERAENIMIVDMVRNDLGRIAEPGTVKVTECFSVEKYPTLYQLTSAVEARTTAPLVDIFKALFPPASITGAPKARTMEIIAELETTPRRIYTGTMGFLQPGRKAQFNVAIRTLLIDRKKKKAEYGVGGGIIWDSNIEKEFEECSIKARICMPQPAQFSLLETLLWNPQEGYYLLERHLKRMGESATYFDYPLDKQELLDLLKITAQPFTPIPHRVRLLLDKQGSCNCRATPMQLPAQDYVARVTMAEQPVNASDVFLYHKTTNRTVYANAKQQFPDHDDVILFNELGEVTESTIANVVLEIDQTLYTPPVHCGLLAGTYRSSLLESGTIRERVITVEMLHHRQSQLYLINSVRGMYQARLSSL